MSMNGTLPYEVEIEILRGRAQYRRRAVAVPVYLIGAAADCDLVLADPRIPDVHTYLYVTPHGVSLRHLGFEPDLEVDGATTEYAQLHDGQCFRLGRAYEFRIHIRSTGGQDGPKRIMRLDPAHGHVPAANADFGHERVYALLAEVRTRLRSEPSNRQSSRPANTPTIRQILLRSTLIRPRASA
jgi:hypothetical protein